MTSQLYERLVDLTNRYDFDGVFRLVGELEAERDQFRWALDQVTDPQKIDAQLKEMQELLDERDRLKQRVESLEAALNALSQQHMWHAGYGGCQCEAHRKVYELLKGTEFEDAQRRSNGRL